jgi:hypothetical protein
MEGRDPGPFELATKRESVVRAEPAGRRAGYTVGTGLLPSAV